MAEQLYSRWQLLLDDLCSSDNRVHLKKEFNNKARVKECYKNKFIHKTLLEWICSYAGSFHYKKNENEAAEFRKKGNNLFLRGQAHQSLYYYTKAILLAPRDSEEIQLAYGNRSAALFTIGKYQECLGDISYATAIDKIPTSRDVRLIIRKGKAYEFLNCFTEASETYNLAETMILKCSNQEEKKLKQLKAELTKNLVNLDRTLKENKSENCKMELMQIDTEFHKIVDNFKSTLILPDASIKLRLRTNPKLGRYIVAEEDISDGEVLFLEKPFAFVILPNYAFERCQGCCKEIFNPLPCKHCSEACFCSKGCRRLAWNKFHKWECGLGLDLNYMIGIAHLGFRVAISGVHNPKNEDYLRVLSLEHHLNALHQDDLYQYTLTATLLIIYLEKFTKLFYDSENRENSLLELGGLILLHIGQMICNGHAITAYVERQEGKNENVFSEHEIRIATAIYPSASMMNHSCEPSIINSFHDDCLIVRAIKDIKKNEEIYNCYGPHFRRMKKEERRTILLEQYRFICNCEHCSLEIDFCERFNSYSCANKGCKGFVPLNKEECYLCKIPLPQRRVDLIKAADEKLKEAKRAESVGRYTESIYLAKTVLKVYRNYLYEHNIKILECRDFLAQISIEERNYHESYQLVEQNLKGNTERFGSHSIEIANELIKLNDITVRILKLYMDNPQQMKKNADSYKAIFSTIVQYSKQAKGIYKLYFGKMNNKYVDMKQQLKLIQFSIPEIQKYLNS